MKKLFIVLLTGLIIMGLVIGASARPIQKSFCGWTDKEITTVYGSTGSVDIKTVKTLYFDPYIQPGEQLCVRFWVKNVGKCPVIITVKIEGVPNYLKWKFYPGLNLGNLNPGYKRNVALCISMPCGTCQNHSDDKFKITVIFYAEQNQRRIQTP